MRCGNLFVEVRFAVVFPRLRTGGYRNFARGDRKRAVRIAYRFIVAVYCFVFGLVGVDYVNFELVFNLARVEYCRFAQRFMRVV